MGSKGEITGRWRGRKKKRDELRDGEQGVEVTEMERGGLRRTGKTKGGG